MIFIHGNGDLANGRLEDDQVGWKYSLDYFLTQGYTMAELYGTTWGFADVPHEGQHFHSAEYLLFLRKFVEAVLEYTGADKVDVIAHSMGVTFSRRILKGGKVTAVSHSLDLGPPLTDRVDTYLGIAGPNWGLSNCAISFYDFFKCCNN